MDVNAEGKKFKISLFIFQANNVSGCPIKVTGVLLEMCYRFESSGFSLFGDKGAKSLINVLCGQRNTLCTHFLECQIVTAKKKNKFERKKWNKIGKKTEK